MVDDAEAWIWILINFSCKIADCNAHAHHLKLSPHEILDAMTSWRKWICWMDEKSYTWMLLVRDDIDTTQRSATQYILTEFVCRFFPSYLCVFFSSQSCGYVLMCVSVHGLHRAWVKQCLWLYHLYDISTFNKCPSLTLLAYDVFAVWHYMFIEMERKINVVASLRCWYLVGRYICNIRNQAVYFIIILVLFRSMCVCSRYINE